METGRATTNTVHIKLCYLLNCCSHHVTSVSYRDFHWLMTNLWAINLKSRVSISKHSWKRKWNATKRILSSTTFFIPYCNYKLFLYIDCWLSYLYTTTRTISRWNCTTFIRNGSYVLKIMQDTRNRAHNSHWRDIIYIICIYLLDMRSALNPVELKCTYVEAEKNFINK